MKTICLLLAFCAFSAYGRVAPVIVGGREAPEGKYPYQVSLRKYGQHSCGASIINQRYILTAAHCIYRLARVYPAEATIHVGTNSRLEPGDVYDVERTIVHSGYVPGGGIDDIGLIRVTKDIQFNEKVQPIPLATTNFGSAGEVAVLTGWGTLEEDGEAPERLQEIDLEIEPQRSCKWFHVRVSNAQICTLTKVGEGACHGDSGGPLVLNGVQIGLVSYSSGCAAGVPDVFTRVYHFQDWIKKNMMP